MSDARGTGFHRNDPDWTRGRSAALKEAETIARRQDGLMRRVSLAAPNRTSTEQESDTPIDTPVSASRPTR